MFIPDPDLEGTGSRIRNAKWNPCQPATGGGGGSMGREGVMGAVSRDGGGGGGFGGRGPSVLDFCKPV
jgi:hypothetical protein